MLENGDTVYHAQFFRGICLCLTLNSFRLHGDVLSCRRAFQRAVQINIDSPEKLCEAYVHFERIEGILLLPMVFRINHK